VSDTPVDASDEHASTHDSDPLIDAVAPINEAPDEHLDTETPVIALGPVESHDAAAAPAVTSLRDPASSSSMTDETPLSSQVRRNRGGLWSTRVSLLLVAALVGGLAGHFASTPSTHDGAVTINEVSNPPGAATTGGKSIPKLVQKVLPSVVSIKVVGSGSADEGTGMIISKNGLVVTNNHVIAAAATSGTITITRSGTTKSEPATLVGTNPVDDVALIRINNASNLPTVTFGNSNKLEAGDSVVAIGNALGLAAGTPTVTSGIVSALGRTVTAGTDTSSETLNNMIQTDAAINPGNSGGPLLDSAGDVIGMNTAVAGTLSDGENTQNIGFAIPVATIQSLLSTLMAGESVVTHGAFIGVEIESMTPSLQAQYGFTVSSGAVVMSVISGTGAAKAGVEQGDIIVGINSTTIDSAQDVSSVISSLHPGQRIALHIVRGTKHIVLEVTLGKQPSS
jgi:putative serine protease PepD